MDPFKEPEFFTEFIQRWKELPVLWQTKSKINKNKDARKQALETLLAFVSPRLPHATTDTVKNKINSIRGTYRTQRSQVLASMRSGAAADSIYKPNLWYYGQMQFIDDHLETRASVSTLPPRNQSSLPGSQEQATSDEDLDFMQDTDCDPSSQVVHFNTN